MDTRVSVSAGVASRMRSVMFRTVMRPRAGTAPGSAAFELLLFALWLQSEPCHQFAHATDPGIGRHIVVPLPNPGFVASTANCQAGDALIGHRLSFRRALLPGRQFPKERHELFQAPFPHITRFPTLDPNGLLLHAPVAVDGECQASVQAMHVVVGEGEPAPIPTAGRQFVEAGTHLGRPGVLDRRRRPSWDEKQTREREKPRHELLPRIRIWPPNGIRLAPRRGGSASPLTGLVGSTAFHLWPACFKSSTARPRSPALTLTSTKGPGITERANAPMFSPGTNAGNPPASSAPLATDASNMFLNVATVTNSSASSPVTLRKLRSDFRGRQSCQAATCSRCRSSQWATAAKTT